MRTLDLLVPSVVAAAAAVSCIVGCGEDLPTDPAHDRSAYFQMSEDDTSTAPQPPVEDPPPPTDGDITWGKLKTKYVDN